MERVLDPLTLLQKERASTQSALHLKMKLSCTAIEARSKNFLKTKLNNFPLNARVALMRKLRSASHPEDG
jgi:hypothetical protein